MPGQRHLFERAGGVGLIGVHLPQLEVRAPVVRLERNCLLAGLLCAVKVANHALELRAEHERVHVFRILLQRRLHLRAQALEVAGFREIVERIGKGKTAQ